MRTLLRNKRPVWVCTYEGITDEVDSDGFLSGEHPPRYNAPVRLAANVSPAKGKVALEFFGNDLSYDKLVLFDCLDGAVVFSPADADGLLTSDGFLFGVGRPIDENAVLFIDRAPTGTSAEGYDYIVVRIARSFNYVAVAVKKVNSDAE